ncbi:MAG TPA: hypothetical protein VFZ67_02575 [Nitrososphaera sp.]
MATRRNVFLFLQNPLKGHLDDNTAGTIKQYNIKYTSIVKVVLMIF